MKMVKRVTAFLLLPIFMFGGGFAAGTAAMDYFYPGRNFGVDELVGSVLSGINIDYGGTTGNEPVSVKAADLDRQVSVDPVIDERLLEPQAAAGTSFNDDNAVEVALQNNNSINADTVYVIQEYSRLKNDLTEEVVPVPENFIGMNFEIFSSVMSEFDRFPTLSELQKGFVGCEIISFSPSRVIIRKTYDDLAEELLPGYYLVNESNLVSVYLADMKTVFMNTNIAVYNLPSALRQEILYTKYIANEEELYGFLEAYSS
jgi:hypothetical protein